uniref:Mediator of RNA polymerase II transcription subunit 23 n=1 Tax=Heterorhabditis bacteriophora TaxID=37862 RepID=A0A1I7X1X0_HETBA
MVRVLNQMVFQCHVIQLDRLLLSLVMHPVTDHSSQLALHIVQVKICFLYHNFFFSFKKYILSISAAPITFVYTILYCMHEQLGHLPRARQFVLAILCQDTEIRLIGDDSPLTQSFITFNHQRVNSFEELVHELIDRVIVCSEFILKPPPYIAQDWRFAEYSPAAQALYLACIELLASPHSPNHIVPAMINLLSSRPQPRPYMTLNAIALLLTALPDAYCQVLQNEFLAVIDSGLLSAFLQIEDSINVKMRVLAQNRNLTFEDIVFDNFEESLLLQMGDRSIVISVIAQAYWHHGNMLVLSRFMSSFVSDVCARVKTENELWYALRLIVPLLHRCYDSRDKVKHLEEVLRAILIFTIVNTLILF